MKKLTKTLLTATLILGLRADGMIKHAEVMKQFAEANQ